MGRVNTVVDIKYEDTEIIEEAQVDSGADVSVLKYQAAKDLHFQFPPSAASRVKDVGGGDLLGFYIPVEFKVLKKKVNVTAFVPMARYEEKMENGQKRVSVESVDVEANLLGADYLQRSKSKLDYSRPHHLVLSEGTGTISYLRRQKITAAQRRLLMDFMRRTFGDVASGAAVSLSKQVRSMLKK